MIFRHRKRLRELDHQVELAEAEKERSERRLKAIQEHVIEPLVKAGERNQFADLIRRSLAAGHGGDKT